MQVTLKKSENLRRELDIIVKAADIQEKIDEKLVDLSKTVKMPGFRPGKVPVDMVRKKHGASVTGEVLEQVINQTSQEALEKEDIRPAMQPKIEIVDFKEGADLTYSIKLEVLPKIPEVDFSKITLETPVAKIDDKDVDEALKDLAAQTTHYHKVKTNRAAKEGDALLMDFKGMVDGEGFDGGTAEKFQLVLGRGQFIPGFEDQLIGVKGGDKKDVNVTFPESYHSAELAGKDAVFEVNVHEVQEKDEGHEINDELASHFGLNDLDSLKEALSDQLKREADSVARAYVKKQLFDQMDKKYVFDIPEEMAELEFDAIWQQVERLKETNPESDELKKPEEELKKEYKEMANRRVRLGIILAEIGKENKIGVDQNELAYAVRERASQFPGQEENVLEYYKKNPEALEEFRGPLLEEKVVDFVMEKVKTKDKELSLEDIRKLQEDM